MKQEYWEHFTQTGKVEDYLFYKGMTICSQVMERYGERSSESVDRSDRDDPGGGAGGRI